VTVARAATVTIGGHTVTITQAAAPCTYTLSPTTASITAAGGTGTITVTTGTGCSWTAISDSAWLTLSPTSGSANGSVSYTAAPANAATIGRAATVTIGEQTVTITQAAAPCTYALAPTTTSVGAAGGTGPITVTAGTGCAWSATSDSGWLTVSPTSGSANGSVT